MTDKELLELAAKAAGYSIQKILQSEREENGYGHVGLYIKGVSTAWNPLTHDGDAFRLAVRLLITPNIDGSMTDCEDCTESHCEDPYSATRRAIVRAAAEIGKGILTHDEFAAMFSGRFLEGK